MNEYSGLIQNPIRTVQSNLKQYKYRDGFPILKELIQNASDAGASSLQIFYYKGIKDAFNPLFRKEGVLVYNDGPFTDDNAEKIIELGGDDKWKDSDSIGKYGLGLKSIFHLCDAFIFYNHADADIEIKWQIVCPFFGSRREAEYKEKNWHILSEDKSKFLEFIKEKVGEQQQGLSLFLPFETDHSPIFDGQKRTIFTKHPFNANDSQEKHLIRNLISTFATLSQTAKKKELKTFFYQMEKKSLKVFVRDNEIEVEEQKEDGQLVKHKSEFITIPTDASDEKTKDVLEKIKEAIPEENRDKVFKDTKIIFEFLKTPKIEEKAKLNIIFAAYLPLPEQKGIESIPLEGNFDYNIIIHAPFAVDSGRCDIEGFLELYDEYNLEKVKSHVYEYWNRFLYQNYIAPHIVHLLNNSIRKAIVEKSDFFDIISGLKKELDFSTSSSKYLYKDYGLVYEFVNHEFEWKLVDPSNLSVVYIPHANNFSFDSILDNVQIPSNTHLLFYDKVKGAKGHFLPDNLLPNVDFVIKFLQHLIERIDGEDGLVFLESFLKCNRIKEDFSEWTRECLKKCYCELLNRLKYNFVSNHLDLIKSITRELYLIFSIEYYELNDRRKELKTDETWAKLWQEQSPYIIIPTQETETKRINAKNVDGWIEFVTNQRFHGSINKYLIKHLVDDFACVLNLLKSRFVELPFFEAHKIGNESIEYLSFKKLKDEPVFERFDGSENIVYHFSKLLNYDIYMTSENADGHLYSPTKEGVIKCLARYYKQWYKDDVFVELEKKDFLNRIFDYDFRTHRINNTEVPFYLFLLSDFKLPEDDSKPIIFDKDCCEALKDIYKKIGNFGQKILLELNGYRFEFFENNKDFFGDNIVTEEKCIRLLNQYSDLSFLLEETFKKNRVTIIKKILEFEKDYQNEDSLYLRVPLHRLSDGSYGAFRKGMLFNKNNIDIPLENLPQYIVCEEDNQLRTSQDKAFTTDNDRVLTISKAIRFLFENECNDISHHLNWIFSKIKENQKVPEADWDAIFSKSWIPVSSGPASSRKLCALKDIILDDFCLPRCSSVLRNNLEMYSLLETQISSENRNIVKNFISNNYKNKDGSSSKFIDTIIEKIELQKHGYIKFDGNEKNIWNEALELKEAPIFSVFYALKMDGKYTEDVLWNKYQSIKLDSRMEQNLGIQLLNQIVQKEYNNSKRILFCKIFKLIYTETFDISAISKYPTQNDNWENPDRISVQSDREDIDKCFKIANELDRDFRENDNESDDTGTICLSNSEEALDVINTNWRNACKSQGYIDVILHLLQGEFKKKSSYQITIKNALKRIFDEGTPMPDNSNIKYDIDKYPVRDRYNPTFDNFPTISVSVLGSDYVSTTSLLGNKIELPKTNSSVYKKGNYYHQSQKEYHFEIYKLPDYSYSKEAEVDNALEAFVRTLLENVYRIKSDNEFGINWDNLRTQITLVKQISIGAAENRIFSGLFDSLAGLKDKRIRELNNEYNKLFERTEGFQPANNDTQNKLLSQLRELVKNDADVQNEIFNRVKKTVQQNQYSVTSIIFELFQNADDCVNDYEVNNHEISDEQRRFEIQDDGHCIKVTHYGRKINEVLSRENENKHKWDLLNMLKLTHSEKGIGDSGKFGLGFKSVYTLSKHPIVRSGELQFEIVAGLFPKKADYQKEYQNCTCIELPYDNKIDAEKCISKFEENCLLTTIFSKQIDQIKINEKEYACQKENVETYEKCNIKKIRFDDLTLLMIEPTDNSYKLLFKINENDCIESLKNSIPKVWNLAPLEDARNLPFIINANLEVDTGRLNLAGNNVNEEPLKRIADSLVEILIELYDYKQNYVNGILDSMLNTYSMHDGWFDISGKSTLFKNFGTNVLHGVFRKLGIITNGCKECIKISKSKIYAINVQGLTDYETILLKSLANYADANIITDIAGNAYSDILECTSKSIYDIFGERIENKEIDYDDLNRIFIFYALMNPVSRRIFWFNFSEINTFKLRNQLEDFKPIEELKLFSEDPEKAVNERYYEKPELKNFLSGIEALKEVYDTRPVYNPMPPVFEFPKHNVKNWNSLRTHMQENIEHAKDVKYELVERTERTTIESENNKAYLRNMYGNEVDANDSKKACQLCHKPTFFFESVELKKKPKKELSALFLCLCPNCAAKYREYRENANSCISILNSIRQLTPEDIDLSTEHVDIPLGENDTLWFTQRHIAEIWEILNTVETDDSVETEFPTSSN